MEVRAAAAHNRTCPRRRCRSRRGAGESAMWKHSARYVVAAWVIATAFAATRLTVLVYDYAAIPGRTLRQSLRVAQELFVKPNVPTEWRAPGAEVQSPKYSVTVRILEGHSRVPPATEAFGAALIPGGGDPAYLADIFYGNLQEALAGVSSR